jgi:hypothetical protein
MLAAAANAVHDGHPPRGVGKRRSRPTNSAGSLTCVLASLCCWSAGFAKEAPPRPKLQIPSHAVLLTGQINEAMVEHFNQAISERNVTAVYIGSPGGFELQAMQIAETVRARHMDVLVFAICAGPCAHTIFVAGRTRRIEPNSLVIFGSSSAGLGMLLDRVGDNVPQDFRPDAQWREVMAAQARLFTQAGVSTSLLLDAQLAQQPRCLIFNRRGGKPAGTSMQMTYAMWVPSRKQLADAGLVFDGYWPKSRSEMLRIAAPMLTSTDRSDPGNYVRFGDADNLRNWRQGKYDFRQLKGCALEEENQPPVADGSPTAE